MIPLLCQLLTVTDASLVDMALDSLSNMINGAQAAALNPGDWAHNEPGNLLHAVLLQIETCGGRTRIAALQRHSEEEICQTAYYIIDQYFPGNV